MYDPDIPRLLKRCRMHLRVVKTGEEGRCDWCGTIWPCDISRLLEIIDDKDRIIKELKERR